MDILTVVPDVTVATQAVADTATNALGGSTSLFGGFGGIAIYMIFIIGVMYFIAIRPQKKREKELKKMVSAIRAGDSIVTNSGLYGKVVDVTEGCFIVEFGTNKGIRIPVEKSEVAAVREPNLTVKKYDEIPAEKPQDEKTK